MSYSWVPFLEIEIIREQAANVFGTYRICGMNLEIECLGQLVDTVNVAINNPVCYVASVEIIGAEIMVKGYKRRRSKLVKKFFDSSCRSSDNKL